MASGLGRVLEPKINLLWLIQEIHVAHIYPSAAPW